MKKKQNGFSLLEAMVAIAILAMSSVTLYAWLGQMTSTVERANKLHQQDAIKRSVLSYLRSVNPQVQTESELRLGEVRVKFESQEVKAAKYYQSQFDSQYIENEKEEQAGGKKLSLHKINIHVLESNKEEWQFEVYHTGFEPVSELELSP